MAYGQSSGTYFRPFSSDLVQDALERADIFAPELKHMTSARRSANLILASKWSNRGINLFKIDSEPTVVPLVQGVIAYNLPSQTIAMYDTYRRQYPMNGLASAPLNFSTTINSSIVACVLASSGAKVGSYIQIGLQVAVGGVVLYGFYLVLSTPDANTFTFDAGVLATSTVASGGGVPVLTTTAGSQLVNVQLTAHGLAGGQPFMVPVSTTVGGIPIFGSYTVTSVVDANNFTITATSNANSSQTVTENAGQAYLATQNQNAPYTDILMTPISRNDYAAQANKTAPGAPTSYWYEKLINPVVRIWPVTDNTGPYELRTYLQTQIQQVNATGGETLDMVQRFLYAFTCDLAADLAIKFSPKKYQLLAGIASDAWADASATDVEQGSTFIVPAFPRI